MFFVNQANAHSIRRGLPEHLLTPSQQAFVEVPRKQVLARTVVVTKSKSKEQDLMKVIMKVCRGIRGTMHRWRRSALVSKHIEVDAEFYGSVMNSYMLASGFYQLATVRKGYYRYSTTDVNVVKRAFCLAQYMPNALDPSQNVEFVRSSSAFQTQLEVNVMQNPALVQNLFRATKAQLQADALVELAGASLLDRVPSFNKGQLIQSILDHRMQTQSYLGIRFMHALNITDDHPFSVYVHPTANKNCIMRLRFRVKKQEAVFTPGHAQPIRVNTIYS